MHIKMSETKTGSFDGNHIHVYEKGETYPKEGVPLSDSLATVFIDNGWAREIRPRKKKKEDAPENKAEE